MDLQMRKHECEKCSGKYCARKAPFFSMLDNEQITEITRLISRRTFKNGQMIFVEGDLSDRIHIINYGKVKIYRYTKEGKEQILYILGPGDFIGDLSLLKKGKFEFNAEALEDVSICNLTKDDFDKIIRSNSEISLKVLESLHDRIINLENLIQTLNTKDVEARIAGLLIYLARDFGSKENGKIIIETTLSREEMANYIGITRETMSRKLTSMQDEGYIEIIGNKKIIIKNIESLRDLCS